MPEIKIESGYGGWNQNYKLFSLPDGKEIGMVRGKVFSIRSSYIGEVPTKTRIFKLQRNLWQTRYKLVDEKGKYIAHFKTPFISRKALKLYTKKTRYLHKTQRLGSEFFILNPRTEQEVVQVSKKLLSLKIHIKVKYTRDFDKRMAIAAGMVVADRY